ncbi:hypothetical protein SCORR_v1c06540 [Spiroplasma corruscae]|uniref:Uncharacterized protein n=1 Tax=Spiroplasma corruscae TaxID=216934 RepID=A0A222EPQ6_9MOLU|nr:hypothetical protein [Spiroplasma corruscae]ASP28426.1 hypothetical protein SCORR_v1c06540 [Spiroplasma corruscae]
MKKSNERDKTKFTINSSVAVTLFSTLLFIISAIYISLNLKFEYWYLYITIVVCQLLVSLIYTWYILCRIDIYGSEYNTKTNMKLILAIIFLELLFLNVFAFIYGLYSYIRIFYRTKQII